MDILSTIIKKKNEEVEYLKKNVSISKLEKSIYFNTKTNSLVKSAIQVEDSENYNAHPYQKLPVIKKYKNGNTIEALKWGIVPSWAKNKEYTC